MAILRHKSEVRRSTPGLVIKRARRRVKGPISGLTMLTILAVTASPGVFAADSETTTVAAAVTLESRVAVCAACHGENGVSTGPQFPNLAGQHEDYLYHSLKAYKNGERNNAIMTGQVIELTDREMRDLAKWYADQDPVLYTPPRGEW